MKDRHKINAFSYPSLTPYPVQTGVQVTAKYLNPVIVLLYIFDSSGARLHVGKNSEESDPLLGGFRDLAGDNRAFLESWARAYGMSSYCAINSSRRFGPPADLPLTPISATRIAPQALPHFRHYSSRGLTGSVIASIVAVPHPLAAVRYEYLFVFA